MTIDASRTTERHQIEEETIINRAREKGGTCFLDYGEANAALRLTQRGTGHWEQNHPFIAEFVLDNDPALTPA